MVAVYSPAVGGVERGEARVEADRGNDHVKVGRTDDLADQILHSRHVLFGDFNACSGGHFQVDGELAGVGAREEGHAEERIDRETGRNASNRPTTVRPGRRTARRTVRS